MENRESLVLSIKILIIFTLLAPSAALGYARTTHEALTSEIIKFFEAHYPENSLGDDEKELVIQGSYDEDDGIRPLRHFYDPVYNEGIMGQMTSKRWVGDTLAQALFSPRYSSLLGNVAQPLFASDSDHSWERGIYEYVHGDKDRGLMSLGHVLHLVQDATVPDHTRGDPHPPFFDELIGEASPYESWARVFDISSINVYEDLVLQGDIPILIDNLDEYFDKLAEFSNSNFFSKDTILIDKYASPSIIGESSEELSDGEVYNFGFTSVENRATRLTRIDKVVNIRKATLEKFYYVDDPDKLILSDYWKHLSRQAVLNGAGVVKLFFDEVEKEQQTLTLYNKNKSWIARVADTIAGAFSRGGSGSGGSGIAAVVESGSGSGDNTDTEPVGPDLGSQLTQRTDDDSPNEETPPPANAPEENQPDPVPDNNQNKEPVQEDPDDSSERRTRSPGFGGGGGATPPPPPQLFPQPPADTMSPGPPTITSPSSTLSTFTNNSITFSGTAEASSTISTNFSGQTATTTALGEWLLSLTLPQGTTTIQFFATDASNNTSSSTSVTLEVDSVLPDITLSVAECTGSFSVSSCLIATTTVSASWSSTAPDLSHFTITQNGSVSTTTATSTRITIPDGTTLSLEVTSNDFAGNASSIAQKEIEAQTIPVTINEIAWAGTATSSSDEWIELYNNSNASINLSDWTLHAEDGVPYINLSGTISPKGYYLIERTDDNTVSDITADLAVPFSGVGTGFGLENAGESLILTYAPLGVASTTIDRTGVHPNGKWFGGNTTERRTLEKFHPTLSGLPQGNWSTNNMLITNGLDAGGAPLNGTPRAKNSVAYYINKNQNLLNEDYLLTEADSPYLVNNMTINVTAGNTLTIEPGVIIKFYNDSRLSANGNIVADGTAAKPIVFTSFSDDEHGGDMNGDGTTTSPIPGGWFGLDVSPGSSGSVFDNVIVRYGGKFYTGGGYTKAGLYVEEASPPITNSVFEYSKVRGLHLFSASSTVTGNTFRGNNSQADSAGLRGLSGAPRIEGNTFEGNEVGIFFADSSADILDNVFTDNLAEAGRYFARMGGEISGNSGSGNGKNGIVIEGKIVSGVATTTLKANSIPYLVSSADLSVSASSTLVIDPGVTLKFKDKRVIVEGRLEVRGGSPSEVLLTSVFDDSDGNDAFGDGASTGVVSGQQGVQLKPGSSSSVEGAEFRFMKRALEYQKPSPINLEDVVFRENELGIFAELGETIERAVNVSFVGNVATSTITLP